MLRTKLLATAGLILTVDSTLFRSRWWGYLSATLMLQAGILFLGLGLFYRLTGSSKPESPIAHLYDLES